MGFFSSLGDAFGFGDSGAGDAANQINLANEQARETQSRSFRETEQNFLDILQGQRSGEIDPTSETELLVAQARKEGQSQQFIDELISGSGGPGFESQRNRLRNIIGGPQRLREGGGLEGRINQFGELEGRALQGVEQGANIQGFDQRLGDIFGSQNFQNLRDERTRALQGQLAAGGLTRSGTALREIANVPTQLGFDIENQQFGRQQGLAQLAGGQFNTGLNQQINLQTNLENFRRGLAGQLSGIQQQTGQNEASGILTGRQAQAAGIGNLASLAGGIATGGLSTIGQDATGFTGALGRFGRSFQ